MPAGSALIYLGSLWHGGGANRTDEAAARRGVALRRRWLRPVENHVLVVPPAVARDLPERLQELLGLQHPAAVHRLRRRSPPEAAARRLTSGIIPTPSTARHALDRAALRGMNCGPRPGRSGGRHANDAAVLVRARGDSSASTPVSVTVIGLGVTFVLGLGITQLEFATGQDSYLNKDDQVYKDNVVYQGLFGGQAMLTVITMDPGHTVDELFTPANRAQLQQFHDDLLAAKTVHGVITPLTILQFADSLVSSPDGNPTTSIAGKALLDRAGEGAARVAATQVARADGRGQDARAAHRDPGRPAHVRQPRVGEVPPLQQPGRDPARRCARSSSTRRTRRSSRGSPATSRSRTRARRPSSCSAQAEKLHLDERDTRHDRRVGAAQGHQRLPARRHADARRHRGRDHGRDPARAVQGALAAAAAARRARRRGLGVRPRGLPRHPADDRHDRRPAR